MQEAARSEKREMALRRGIRRLPVDVNRLIICFWSPWINSLRTNLLSSLIPDSGTNRWILFSSKITFRCSSGLQPSRQIFLKCHCGNLSDTKENCAYRLTSGNHSTFAPRENFEHELGFSCLEEYEYYDEEETQEPQACAKLPAVKDGRWTCDSGHCTLWYELVT